MARWMNKIALRHRGMTALAAVTLGAVLALVPEATQASPPPGGQVITDIAYAPPQPAGSQGHLLDLYLPQHAREPAPLIIWSRGSGWLAENGRQGADVEAGLDPVTAFPPIRVFGTVGFIVAMWAVSLLHLELSSLQLYIASGASLLLSAYALTLPKIPVAEKKATTSLASKLGLDAFVLFKNPRMAIFFLFAMMLGAVLQITNVFGNPFLHDFARNPEFADSFVVKYPSILLSVSQMAEVGFILTIPFFLKRFGIKTVMLMSMVAWTLRFGFFAYGDPSTTGFILLLLSMIVYGCAFDFFNISGSVFVEQEVDSSIRASAQGLFMTMVNGVGAWVGSILSGMAVDYFSVDGVKDWQTIWLVFAGYALFLAVIFFFGFKYNYDPEKIKHRAVAH